MTVESIQPYLEPLRKSVVVACDVATAFELFTSGVHRWWPLRTHSISLDRAVRCEMEPRPAGALFEVRDDGTRLPWGWVEAWEPPHRLVLRWHPGAPPETAQQVEVRFSGHDTGTLVELEHRDWQKLADRAARARDSYDKGWEIVLNQHFVPAAGA